ncbi:unnamed protein product [Caenorhabditis sp. 36 PRJEB53466]|nr:unnamed protein product [Caenorhabditis sp. 36 PRJEB53466]
MANRLAKLFTNSFKLATSDLANQYALPVKSMTGHAVSKYGAAKTRRLNEKVVEKMDVGKNDLIFEIGFGRGDALQMCFERVKEGRGIVFGVERSGYMDERARKRFILEIAETDKIRIDSATDLRNLPYPTDLFNHVFHVDVFYFFRQDHLIDINRELLRVLKPGGSLTVGMQFSRLKQLTEHGIVEESQWNPMRYLTALEAAQFSDVQINYHKDSQMGEYQIISARKSANALEEEDPEELLRQLAMDIKRERLAVAMMNNKKDINLQRFYRSLYFRAVTHKHISSLSVKYHFGVTTPKRAAVNPLRFSEAYQMLRILPLPLSTVISSSDVPYTSTTSSSSTTDPSCSVQCPDGYLIGTSSCYILYASSKAPTYQSSLALCMATDRQTLASLDSFRDRNDIQSLQSGAAQQSSNWFFANGIGSRRERFDKTVDVYSIFDQTIVAAPVATTVTVSETFSNVSTLCVMPQYCAKPVCNVDSLMLTFDYSLYFKYSAKSLQPKETATLTCIYTQKQYTITCGALGNVYPEPSFFDCQRENAALIMKDTTNETVSSCAKCYKRGTGSCEQVTDGNGTELGVRCICKRPFTMARCWYTPDTCTDNYCGANGTCYSEMGGRRCECDSGYSGSYCETEMRTQYSGRWEYSMCTGLIIALGGFLVRMIKAAVYLHRLDMSPNDDPQCTHQATRSYCMFVGGILVAFFSNPAFLDINQAACRFHFIFIHFCFLMGMMHWLLEGWNVNQVLRCVHLNEWERDWDGNKAWGVRIAPRMLFSFLAVATGLLITFQAGWNQLAATWTCVGVINQSTASVWIPIFVMVAIICIYAGAICESSILIKFRRPLLAYRMDMRIEREIGHVEGRRIEKVRRNEVLCLIGLFLLVFVWFMVILSSDNKDDGIVGWMTIISAFIYSLYSFYQESETCPEDRAIWISLLQRVLPLRFAPSYNPETMWTVDEVKQMYSMPETERKHAYQHYIPRNNVLHLHHRWDLRFNELLTENELTINDALVRVFCEEMNRLKERNGTVSQKYYIMDAYKDFLRSIPDYDPRTEEGRVKTRLELVTLAAEAPIGVKLAKFFIVPGFDVFRPEIPDEGGMNRNANQHMRLLQERIQMKHYKIMREEAHAQAVFINSNILFHYFGNEVVR